MLKHKWVKVKENIYPSRELGIFKKLIQVLPLLTLPLQFEASQ